MYCRVLRVLMWRHWLARKREYFTLLTELVGPVLPFVIIFSLRDKLFPATLLTPQQAREMVQPPSIPLRNTLGPPCVLYTPDTDFTMILMDLVGQKLNLQPWDRLPRRKTNRVRGYFPFNDASVVFKFTKDMGPNEAVVVFHNISEYSWPESLSYSIRMKSKFNTYIRLTNGDERYETVLLSLRKQVPVTISVPFLRLQWAIDTSFIQILSGKEVKQNVTLRKLPHLKYARRSNVYSIKSDTLFFAAGISILPAFYNIMLRKIVEKANGVQDLIKTMGVTAHTLFASHALNAILPGLIYSVGATALLKLEPMPVLEKSNGFLIFLALFLQFIFTVCAAMVSSYIASKAPPTALTVSAAYTILVLPAVIWNGMDVSNFMIYPIGLMPYMPLAWVFKEACKLEVLGSGLTFSTMMKYHTSQTGPAIVAYLNFFIHITLCLVLFWYLDHVVAGIYGSTYPWYFFLKKRYWIKKFAKPSIETKTEELEKPSQESREPHQYFEKPPENIEAGIRVINVTKEFANQRALNNLSLDVYKGEITILLGHNGAGKSTLISIITGIMGPSKGTVLVNGVDIAPENMSEQQHIGLCPQANMFFENITVIEHIMFYALLNGGTFAEARKYSEELLEKLNLKDKTNSDTTELTGGMKRRLHVACVLAGQSTVLLLDEPTSGVDVESRRTLWNLILALRGSRTVLLSTHYMEEADALGDRVAVLLNGELRCHATPMYLKREISSGYRLTFNTIGLPNEPAITSAIRSVIPDVTIKETGFNSISYNLPYENIEVFPILFDKLETMRAELQIDSIGVGTSTLEEVFLKLCSNVYTYPISEEEVQARQEPGYKKLTGLHLYFTQVLVLLKRYLRFLWMYKYTQIGLGVFRVVILILVITVITNDNKTFRRDDTLLAMNLDLYQHPDYDYRILFKVNGTDSELRPLSDEYPLVRFERASDVSKDVLRASQQDLTEFNNIFAAIELDDANAKVSYTTTLKHAAPAAMNLLTNLILTRAVPWAEARSLTTYNHPLRGAYTPYAISDIEEPKSVPNMKLWMFSTTLMLLSGIIFMVQLPCKDAAGSRHIHVMAGCPPEVHWMTMLLLAGFQVMLTYVVTLALACSYLDHDDTFADGEFIAAASVVVVLGSMAMLSFSYEVSINFTQSIAVGIIGLTMIFFVFLFPVLEKLSPTVRHYKLLALITMPPYTFNEAMADCAMTAYLNTLCKLNRDKCPYLDFPVKNFNAEKCCGTKTNSWCYFCFQDSAPGKKIIFLFVQIFFFMTVVILTQRGFFSLIWEKTINCTYKAPVHVCNDSAVNAEQVYVKKTLKLPPKRIPDIMLVSDVHKNYRKCCKSINAVKGVSFSVKKGECFGLLGVNGSGKSSMFQVLTGVMCPTRGRIIANGTKLGYPLTNNHYLYSLAYCPQSWGLDDFLTGRQNLELLLALKGFNARDTNTEAMTWIKLVGLEKYKDQLVLSYSSGCLRRLAAAAALCTSAPVTLLDEPTAGVDVAARRLVWFALKRGLRNHHAIIVTSHCFDEMEALCHRISIMAAGEICALGSPAGLRAAHASGHSVILKIKYHPKGQQKISITGAPNPKVYLLKAAIENTFRCTLKDEHKTMLHYHINETMHYSQIFEKMELLKSSFSVLIEDYSVSETTLEEVFLSFAKPVQSPSSMNMAVGPLATDK